MSTAVRIPRRENNWSSAHDAETTEALVILQNQLQQRQTGKSVLAAKTIKAYSDALRTGRVLHGR